MNHINEKYQIFDENIMFKEKVLYLVIYVI